MPTRPFLHGHTHFIWALPTSSSKKTRDRGVDFSLRSVISSLSGYFDCIPLGSDHLVVCEVQHIYGWLVYSCFLAYCLSFFIRLPKTKQVFPLNPLGQLAYPSSIMLHTHPFFFWIQQKSFLVYIVFLSLLG